jgi:hypothetical protein
MRPHCINGRRGFRFSLGLGQEEAQRESDKEDARSDNCRCDSDLLKRV